MRGSVALSAVLLCAALPALSQTIAPPGVEQARPPTERTLQHTDKSSTQERVRYSRDCRQVETEILAQYRIQQDSVRAQYDHDSAAADVTTAAREALRQQRDAQLSALQAQGKAAAGKLVAECRADNRQILRGSVSPSDPH